MNASVTLEVLLEGRWHRAGVLEEHDALVREGLRALAERLTSLPTLLRELGLPQETLEFPGLGLLRTEERLRAWGLL